LITLRDAKDNNLQHNYTNKPGPALQTSAGKLTDRVEDNISDPLLSQIQRGEAEKTLSSS